MISSIFSVRATPSSYRMHTRAGTREPTLAASLTSAGVRIMRRRSTTLSRSDSENASCGPCGAPERGIPIISALGTGNKRDAALLEITDISKTRGCALARVVRKELRSRGVEHHTVVYSPEEPMTARQLEAPPPGRRSVPGSLVWVPASAGLLLCQHVVTELTKRAD